ncbi:MAG: hypothetical protein IJ718_05555 [Paludibacteraceae bacterium]|nr:hypothetical protein [Paludibacteraceae bacterium]
MKKTFIITSLTLALVLAGCSEKPYIDAPGDNSHNLDSIPTVADPDPTPDPAGVAVPENAITVNEAVNIGKKLASQQVTDQEYYIKGWITRFDETQRGKADFEDKFKQYGNDYVYLSARQDGQGSKEFYCYRILGKNGAPLPDHEALQIGDFVVVKCKITNYNGIIENNGTCATYSSSNPHFNEVFPPFPGCPEPGEGEISVNRAKEICDSIGAGKTTSESYRIRGVVTSVETKDLGTYGNITFNISSDGDVTAKCYQTYCKTASGKFTNLNQVLVGDTVLVNGKIQNYNGTCEPYRGYLEQSTNPNF